jgi:hypothetical protein
MEQLQRSHTVAFRCVNNLSLAPMRPALKFSAN